MKKHLSLPRALLWIIGSTFIINFGTFFSIKGYQNWKRKYQKSPETPIHIILQMSPQKEALKTTYFAEVLGLSCDEPTLTCQFNPKKAKEKLLASPVIKEVEVKIVNPGVISIDYITYQPIALLAEYKNVAIDQDGYPFPMIPFFTPKNIPEIFLDTQEALIWKKPLQGEKISLAFQVLKIIQAPVVSDLFNVRRIDVSKATERSYARREIVLIVEDEIYFLRDGKEHCVVFPRILRLSTKNYVHELNNYLKLREQLLEKERKEIPFSLVKDGKLLFPRKIIDFRIPQLAFIDEQK